MFFYHRKKTENQAGIEQKFSDLETPIKITGLPAATPSLRLNKLHWQQWGGAGRGDSLGISRFPLQHNTCCAVSTASCYHEKALRGSSDVIQPSSYWMICQLLMCLSGPGVENLIPPSANYWRRTLRSASWQHVITDRWGRLASEVVHWISGHQSDGDSIMFSLQKSKYFILGRILLWFRAS